MGEVPPSHDAVRAYLDSAVAEAAERWVGRAADATAYADLVAAVLARREALSPLRHLPDRAQSGSVGAGPGSVSLAPAAPPPPPVPRHTERRARPRWPLGGGAPAGSIRDRAEPRPIGTPSADPAPASATAPALTVTGAVVRNPAPYPPPFSTVTTSVPSADGHAVDVRGGIGLPSRPPGRHRTPPEAAPDRPDPINLNQNLNTVLDWLGRPEQ